MSLHVQDEQFDRYRILRDQHDREETRVASLGTQVDADADLGRVGLLAAGFDAYLDDVLTTGAQGALTGPLDRRPELARYAPGAGYGTVGAFASHLLPLGTRVSLASEMRVGVVRVSLPEDDRLVRLFPAEARSPLAASTEIVPVHAGGLHARVAPRRALAVSAGVSFGFRAPNLDDYSRLGIEGTGYVVPTRGLRPERSVSGEITFKAVQGEADVSAAYARTVIVDAMTRMPGAVGTLNALDGAPVLRVANGDRLRLHAFELQGRAPVWRRLQLSGGAALAHGDLRRTLPAADPGRPASTLIEPAPRVPPAFGTLALGWRARANRWFVEAVLRFALDQGRISESDRLDTRICPDAPGRCTGTARWATVGIRGSLAFGSHLRLAAGADNLLDTSYRMHGSAIDGPGRGLTATLEGVLP